MTTETKRRPGRPMATDPRSPARVARYLMTLDEGLAFGAAETRAWRLLRQEGDHKASRLLCAVADAIHDGATDAEVGAFVRGMAGG